MTGTDLNKRIKFNSPQPDYEAAIAAGDYEMVNDFYLTVWINGDREDAYELHRGEEWEWETVLDYEQVGAVTLSQFRIFPLDQSNEAPARSEVNVPAGTYPVLRSMDCTFVLWSGQLTSTWRKIGDGLFMGGSDEGWGPTVTFPGRMYGPEQWEEFMADPICQPGPAQRYTIEMTS